MNELKMLAKVYVENGFSVIPVKDKRPVGSWKQYQEKAPSIEEIEGWQGFNGLGLVCGFNDVTVIDFDNVSAYQDWLFYVEHNVKSLPVQKSANGFHVAFRCKEYQEGNEKLAFYQDATDTFSVAIETRGKGGYILVAPSQHPDGVQYEALHGDFHNLPEIEFNAARQIIEFARILDQKKPQEAVEETLRSPKYFSGEGNSVIDAFNLRNDIEDVLSYNGYTRQGSKWLAPGSKSGLPGVVILGDYVYSHHSNDDLNDGKAHDAFDAYRILEHSGDMKEAVRCAATDLGMSYGRSAVANKTRTLDAAPYKNDATNSDKFVQLIGEGNYIFSDAAGWLTWDSKRWLVTDDTAVLKDARKVGEYYIAQAPSIQDSKQRDEMLKWGSSCLNKNKMQALVDLSKADLAIEIAELDKHKYLINLENGTYNLDIDELEIHNKEDYLTKKANVSYDPDAKALKWEQFQLEIADGDTELVRFKQKAYGYALGGDIGAQALFILHGTGANGKSTELGVIAELLGDYASETSFDTFLTTGSDNATLSALAQLQGARFVSAAESEDSSKLNEASVKAITGGEVIQAKRYYQDVFTYRPEFKLFLATNHKPQIKGTDEGIWRRIKLIPYSVTIPVERRNPKLKEELQAEASGILNWLIEGYRLYVSEGLGTTQAIEDATQEYRTEQDVVRQFIEDACIRSDTAQAKASDLYHHYKKWHGMVGISNSLLTNTAFGRRLSELGLETKRTSGGNVRLGIGLVKEADNPLPW